MTSSDTQAPSSPSSAPPQRDAGNSRPNSRQQGSDSRPLSLGVVCPKHDALWLLSRQGVFHALEPTAAGQRPMLVRPSQCYAELLSWSKTSMKQWVKLNNGDIPGSPAAEAAKELLRRLHGVFEAARRKRAEQPSAEIDEVY